MGIGTRAAVAALVWAAGVGIGLVACGGGGGAAPADAPSGATVKPAPGDGGVGSGGTGAAAAAPQAAAAAPMLGSCELFPAQAVFNTRIDDPARFPAHASSAAWITSIG
ncbi:MAG TPA: hypothetical protein VEA40_00985 [Ramlibacter sp.]|nr:hypothetical protein [Ramlibacter sp.]